MKLLIIGLVCLGLTSCSNSNKSDDPKPDPPIDTGSVELYKNLPGYPQIAAICIKGAGFATTKDQVIRIPEWDAFCKADTQG